MHSFYLSIFYHWLWIAFLGVFYLVLLIGIVKEMTEPDETIDEIKHKSNPE